MKNIEKDLKEHFQTEISFSDSFGTKKAFVSHKEIFSFLSFLKKNHNFDFLMNLTAVDYPEDEKRFHLIYELFSSKTYKRLRLIVKTDEKTMIDSVSPLWKSANWFEREIWDLFGIIFKNHPCLKRLLTHHEFKGHALRKDYPADLQQHCKTVMPIYFEDEHDYKKDPKSNLVPLNIGPSHPATHGTLRIMCELDGERINRSHVEIGYLHRCFEKMAETHPYNQVIPYTDRLNYCSAPMNNVAYCKAVEKLIGMEIPKRAQVLRMILCELSRIIDHIVCIGANAVDLGALTGFFHLFTYREKVYTLFEKLCGARLTVSMTRIGGMAQDIPYNWDRDVLDFLDEMEEGIKELDQILTGNKIFMKRTKDIGSISVEEAINWGYTGPCLRACGLPLDLRKIEPYYLYDEVDFKVPVGQKGDVYDRYLVRVEEMRQSVHIIRQLINNIPSGDFSSRDIRYVLPEKKDVYGNIEGLMNHFMLVMHGLRPPKGEIYDYTEAANGELGFYLVSDGSGLPYRLKLRAPCFSIYSSFSEQIKGVLVADVISILGSMNVIAGELDR